MRVLVALWALPLALFWSWYFVSLNDWNFGYVMLSRQLHDLLFQLYGEILGIDPAALPGLLAKGCVMDSFLLAGIIAFRNRKALATRYRAWRSRYDEVEPSSPSA